MIQGQYRSSEVMIRGGTLVKGQNTIMVNLQGSLIEKFKVVQYFGIQIQRQDSSSMSSSLVIPCKGIESLDSDFTENLSTLCLVSTPNDLRGA